MIEGCLDWQANGLVRPESVIRATESYFADQDLLAQWLDEACDAEPGNRYKSESDGKAVRVMDRVCHRGGRGAGQPQGIQRGDRKTRFTRHRGAREDNMPCRRDVDASNGIRQPK